MYNKIYWYINKYIYGKKHRMINLRLADSMQIVIPLHSGCIMDAARACLKSSTFTVWRKNQTVMPNQFNHPFTENTMKKQKNKNKKKTNNKKQTNKKQKQKTKTKANALHIFKYRSILQITLNKYIFLSSSSYYD